MIANGLVRGVLPALGQQKTPATIPHSHRRGKEFRHRSFQAGGQPARAQFRGRSRCPWMTAGHRSLPSVLARIWHRRHPAALAEALPGSVGALLATCHASLTYALTCEVASRGSHHFRRCLGVACLDARSGSTENCECASEWELPCPEP
jgi:hypothetical protein